MINAIKRAWEFDKFLAIYLPSFGILLMVMAVLMALRAESIAVSLAIGISIGLTGLAFALVQIIVNWGSMEGKG